MNKKIIAAAIAASFAAAPAMADVTVYGKVAQSLDFIDDTQNGTVRDRAEINDRSSRLGFKGSEDLGNGLKAIFKIEFNVKASESDPNDGSTAITANRNQYVGLAGDFGTVLMGRHDSPIDMAWSKNNIFGDTIADAKGSYGPLDWTRVDGTIAYVSPSFSGLTGAVAIAPGEESALTPAANSDGIADHWAAMLKYSNAGLGLGLGYQALETTTVDLDDWLLTASYKMDNLFVSLTYEDQGSSLANSDVEAWVINGKYTMGNNDLKIQFTDRDAEAAGRDQDGWAIGLDHKFSKRTIAQITYASVDAESNGTTAEEDGDSFSLQMVHKF